MKLIRTEYTLDECWLLAQAENAIHDVTAGLFLELSTLEPAEAQKIFSNHPARNMLIKTYINAINCMAPKLVYELDSGEEFPTLNTYEQPSR